MSMETLKCINSRRSVRNFSKKDVSETDVDEILSAAVRAPNAGNIQEWRFIVVRKHETMEMLAEASFQQNVIASAPVVIISCADMDEIGKAYSSRGRDVYSIQDAALACQNLMLAAWDKGIGSCWIGSFDEKEVQNILVLPKNVRPLAIIPLGYPQGHGEKQPRKILEEVVHHEFY